MTPQEFEWSQERAEVAYHRGEINAMEFRSRMYALGFKPETCDDILDELDMVCVPERRMTDGRLADDGDRAAGRH